MVVRRNKKVRRQRGTRAHGWGIQKDHKGSGMRGGFGNAGVTQHNWIRTIIEAKKEGRKPIGKYGFKRPQEYIKKYSTINVSHLDQAVDTLVAEELAELNKDVYTINLKALGITKLLAQGNVTRKMNITVDRATERAISKIEEAGGSVTLPDAE
ncbi:MAG: 50S ribosomal protein L15 [Candidatus Heimdallarchaeota archaeon]|nr:50S ribosomal protein L15 [Candidatus Heimdallarchaeota archaeon]